MTTLANPAHDLPMLDISLDRSSSSAGTCILQFQLPGRPLDMLAVDCVNLGLPTSQNLISAYRYIGPQYTLPEPILAAIQYKLAAVLTAGGPLWLRFSHDCGNLPLIPWERLLQPRLAIPLLRMPYYSLTPFMAPESSLDIVLCATQSTLYEPFPVASILETLAHALLASLQTPPAQREDVVIHIFTDAASYHTLQTSLQDCLAPAAAGSVKLYDPANAPPTTKLNTMLTTPANLENPWLHWMLSTFQGHSVDSVHFVGHGNLNLDQGTLILEGRPLAADIQEQQTWFTSTQQLMAFATHIGAWSMSFSSPARNFSGSGLRLLLDQLARLQPGPLLLHELKMDASGQDLAAAYRFLCNPSKHMPPTSSTLAFYCHPACIQQTMQPAQMAALNQYTLAKGQTLRMMQAQTNTPGWVASSQRYLEQSTAQLVNASPVTTATPEATRQGVAHALSFLSDVLEQHAAQTSEQAEPQEPRQ